MAHHALVIMPVLCVWHFALATKIPLLSTAQTPVYISAGYLTPFDTEEGGFSMNTWKRLAGVALAAGVLGCSPADTDPEAALLDADDVDTTPTPLTQSGTVQLNFLFIHGVKGCEGSRLNAENSLTDLENALLSDLPGRVSAYEAAHPGVTVAVHTERANLYTAPASPFHPSDSTNPLLMDDWEVGDPGCSASKQGDPCTTAYEWRYRLAQEIKDRFGPNARNVILVAHSTGARAAFEVAANVGPNGVGTQDWGVQDRIAGVVSVQGMVDGLGTSKYNIIGSLSFKTTCKNGDVILGFGDSCSQGNGWCEYAGDVAGTAAADWVAHNKFALMLISSASCSPALWTGISDGSLPLDAQGSPNAVGSAMTTAPGKTLRPAHGVRYGAFCHSAISDAGRSDHTGAVAAAKKQILDWTFLKAPRVAALGSVSTASSIAYKASTPNFAVGGACPAGQVDEGLEVVGLCKHPGTFDGDDHGIAASEFSLQDGATCNGSFRWTQAHDSNNRHAATFWWKTHALPPEGSLLGTLPSDP
jgi:hypothetical protein